MTEPHRPDPESLLHLAQAAEAKRGRLKIFLGYAAGVGKTYAMLEAAQQRKAEGVDVVIGLVETHHRADTELMLRGLEVLPRREVEYRGTLLTDFDLDAVLARRPQLALVDELAHTNAPGMRHPKRYIDVEEMLAHGIDVYTTLNIQHLESLNDVVAQITGIVVRETVPDSILDAADEIELIDLPPDELMQRLREGKVYIPERAAEAIRQFFRKGNLTALRELSMRRAAVRVDEQMRDYMATRAIPGPWPAAERLLVCIGPGPMAERLVRAGRRMADQLDAEWFAIYVETHRHAGLSEAERDRVARVLRMAEELGAKTTRLPGNTIAETVTQHARLHNITKILIAEPLYPRWVEWIRGSVVMDVIRTSGGIDVYVVGSEEREPTQRYPFRPRWTAPWQDYAKAALLVAIATAVGELVDLFFTPTNLVMLYLLAVLIAALRYGRGPASFSAVLSVIAFDFFFVPPRYTFAVTDVQYLLTFAGLLVVGLVVSTLAAQAREQAKTARQRQRQTAALHDLSRELAGTSGLDSILDVICGFIRTTFGHNAGVFLPEGERLQMAASTAPSLFTENERAVADWAYRNRQQAGRATETLPAAGATYFPMTTANGIIGVIGVIPQESDQELAPEQRRLMESSIPLAALTIERAQLAEQAGRVQLLHESERLQTALLNSISHDLRTPLATITGALSSLEQDAAVLDENARRELVTTALEQAERLNRLVGNLLDMTRLEAGTLRIVRQANDVRDLIGVALQELQVPLEGRQITIDVSTDLPAVPMDLVLMSRVLVNVIDNATKYSPDGSSIEISARLLPAGARANSGESISKDSVAIRVRDHGIGIPREDLTRVFDKFYRVQRPETIGGTGLGLSISRGFVEAHGGRIWAEAVPGEGTTVTIALPVDGSAAITHG
jgi:two-component system sensor histidine kinase KdpD